MVTNDQKESFFAPSGRISSNELSDQVEATLSHPLTKVILEAVSGFVLILNEQRQILSANQEVLDSLGYGSPEIFAGLRPGEIFNCTHVSEGPDGCGTSLHCRTCGAVLSILLCQVKGEPVEDECRMTIHTNGQFMAADFKVKATPLKIGEHSLTILILQDISAFKRREILEKVFIHDLFNTVGGIQGWSEQLNNQAPELAAQQILFFSSLIKEEISFHSLLIQAEKNELELLVKPTYATEIVDHLKKLFAYQQIAQGKHFEISIPYGENCFNTDLSLLLRILINMLKNAFEASEEGDTVRFYFEWIDEQPSFRVDSQTFIPIDVQEHIFERSFSTKGEGRGIGTYSIKLFGEHYLKGKVSFRSTSQEGTSFSIILPINENVQLPSTSQTNSKQPEEVIPDKKIKKIVLLVEDDPSFAELERLLLERLGFEVQYCKNGINAIQVYSTHPEIFYFVITDHNMMPMNGLELASRLLELNPSAIILLCTGYNDPDLIRDAKNVGVSATALKPTTNEELKNLLVNAGLYTDQ